MPRSVSSQDGVLNATKGAPQPSQHYLGAEAGIPAVNTSKINNSPPSAQKIRNCSTKRLSDFGILTSAESVSNFPQLISGTIGQKSPLLMSCSSSVPFNTNPSVVESTQGISRPNTLPVAKQQSSQQFLPVEPAGSNARKLSSTSGKMPLSPLARQSSSSATTASNASQINLQQLPTKITETSSKHKVTKSTQLPNINFTTVKDEGVDEVRVEAQQKPSSSKTVVTAQLSQ